MKGEDKKPSLAWALLTLFVPVAVILYGTVFLEVRPSVLPLLAAVAVAGIMCMPIGYSWEELQEGMFAALSRVQIAIAILFMVGMLIGTWIASGTIPAIIYYGLKLINPKFFLTSALVLCAVTSLATGTSFGTMGTLGVALLGIGGALGYPPEMTVGAVVSGAYLGDKMSPISDSTNIAASVCEVPLFPHIYSLMWTTLPSFIVAGIAYAFIGTAHIEGQVFELESLNAILNGLENGFSLSFWAFIPPVLMIALAYRRFPVLPIMLLCILVALAIAWFEGTKVADMAGIIANGYKSDTGIKQLDSLLSRGGLMSIMSTVLLLYAGVAFGGMLERARVFEVVLGAMLKGAKSVFRLVFSVLLASYIIVFGTGSQILSVVVPGRAFLDTFRKAGVDPRVLSRTCEDAGTIGCPLVPWSIHALYITGILGVSAYDYGPYTILCWIVPVFSIFCAVSGFGIWRTDGTPMRAWRKRQAAAQNASE